MIKQVVISSEMPQAELESFTAYFELLSQIDQRLQNEDPEYRDKYYQQSDLGDKKNANQ